MGPVLVVYGLKTCDTCRKARKWLEAQGIAHKFHDLRADGIAATDIAYFAKAAGWQTLLNKASTTWRSLPKSETENAGEAEALKLMAAHPALIKRPVFDRGGGRVVVGFRDPQKAALKEASPA